MSNNDEHDPKMMNMIYRIFDILSRLQATQSTCKSENASHAVYTQVREYTRASLSQLKHSLIVCAGATSKALQERNPWLTTNLSVLASCAAIVIGVIVLFSL